MHRFDRDSCPDTSSDVSMPSSCAMLLGVIVCKRRWLLALRREPLCQAAPLIWLLGSTLRSSLPSLTTPGNLPFLMSANNSSAPVGRLQEPAGNYQVESHLQRRTRQLPRYRNLVQELVRCILFAM